MAIQRPLLIKLLAPLLAFAATLALVSHLNGSSSSPALSPSRAASADALAARGDALLQKVRETGDPRNYVAAEAAFRRALAEDSHNAAALAGMGSLALGRHDFRGGLIYARRARAEAPEIVRFYGIEVDALVELGRYGEAERVLQRMVDLKPNLSSYARVSYFRELHGDLAGAAEAMRLAVSAGGDAPENVAYVQTLLGNLELDRGRSAAAERSYRLALARFPRYAAARAGLARVAVAQGELALAIRRYRTLVAVLPLPEYVVALGEAEVVAGDHAGAQRDFGLVRIERRLYERSGVNLDLELALFESDHGSAARGLAFARQAWRSAPSVRSADALGWALTRSGQPEAGLEFGRRALRLGSKDPLFLYHAGMSARAAGNERLARRYLSSSLSLNPRFSPLRAPRAQRALRALEG
jgi:tetratricopeptide (TPR) repeat protein